ncbi:MAG TPA: hypothetical protein VL201_04255 [Patescibacteria group bacterium]|jgi:hypothetical protein|nr:hypothetical protein [Patescibacteria group bacterium]
MLLKLNIIDSPDKIMQKYFLYLALSCTPLYGMEKVADHTIIPLETIEKTVLTDQIKQIKKATHYMYFLANTVNNGFHSGTSFYRVHFYMNEFSNSQKNFPIETIFIGLNSNKKEWTKAHKQYCDALLDSENKTFPDFMEIRKNTSEESHSLYLYHKNVLINVHDFVVPEQRPRDTDAHNFMDVRNNYNPCIYYYQPLNFFKNINKIQYHNGAHVEKVLFYNPPVPSTASGAYILNIDDINIVLDLNFVIKKEEVGDKNRNDIILLSQITGATALKPILGASYYTFDLPQTSIVKEKTVMQSYQKIDSNSLPIIIVKFYDNQNKSVGIKEIEGHEWTKSHDIYCNALLDQNTNSTLPNRIEIIYDHAMPPRLLLYNDKILIREISFEGDIYKKLNASHFMDLKNPNYSLLSKVQNIAYHNGFYWKLKATYDGGNKFVLNYTWQHKLIIGSFLSLIGLLLHYVSLKSGFYKLLFLLINQVEKCLF